MKKSDLRTGPTRYRRSHHHAWAGTVMLSVLLSVRIFLEISATVIDDRIFLVLGVVLIGYILIALVLTYRYRFDLDQEAPPPAPAEDPTPMRQDAELQTTQLKAQEKRAKAEAKATKKAAKAAAKARKKDLQ
jgi:hypothetical protein